MRHGKTFNHLGRTASHRRALLSNMASSLILNKRISTTVAKAKELRVYVEPLITKAKNDSTHSRRVVFSYLQNKDSVKSLFGEVADKVADRPGGYTRILKTGNRQGDNAEMCIIELVDFNEFMLAEKSKGKKEAAGKTRRSRRGTGTAKTEAKAEGAEKTTKTRKSAKATEEVEAKAEETANDSAPEAQNNETDNKEETTQD